MRIINPELKEKINLFIKDLETKQQEYNKLCVSVYLFKSPEKKVEILLSSAKFNTCDMFKGACLVDSYKIYFYVETFETDYSPFIKVIENKNKCDEFLKKVEPNQIEEFYEKYYVWDGKHLIDD